MDKPEPDNLLESNKEWAKTQVTTDSEFFSRLLDVQTPNYLWIGCSDSRVPANEIVGLQPGELFVHRNIANVVPHSDVNCLSVIQYAVEVLEIEHIIITGHYGCGGVRAAMDQTYHGQIDNWLAHIKDVYSMHYDRLRLIADMDKRADKLCEYNVMEQVRNVGKTSIVQKAWRNGRNLTVHGWVYSLEDGILQDLGIEINSMDGLHPAYHVINE